MTPRIRLILLVLLTTSNYFQTLNAQAISPKAAIPDVSPADGSQVASPSADSPRAASFPAFSPQAPSPLSNGPQTSILGDVSSRLFPAAMFVFGDSLVDVGNNDFIQSLAKANILYNGIDFPDGPTGRFCNGRTVVDILFTFGCCSSCNSLTDLTRITLTNVSLMQFADNMTLTFKVGVIEDGRKKDVTDIAWMRIARELGDIIGIPYPPAFLSPLANGARILRGVNYASGAGGILAATGANYINRICMNDQIENLQYTTLPQLEAQLGTDATTALLNSSLAAIVVGSNDFINNYLLRDTNSQSQYTPAQFNLLLQSSFTRQLMALYDLGLRMFYVSGIGPLGCIPHQLALSQQPTCVSSVNAQAQDFNTLLRSMLRELNTELPDALFLFGETYDAVLGLIDNPGAHGFTVVNQGCCGGGLYRGLINCQPAALVCANRAEYVFWDGYHPTEASNLILANGIYNGGTNYVTPLNIQQMLALRCG